MARVLGALAEDELFGINYISPAPSVAFETKLFMTQYKTLVPRPRLITLSSAASVAALSLRLLLATGQLRFAAMYYPKIKSQRSNPND